MKQVVKAGGGYCTSILPSSMVALIFAFSIRVVQRAGYGKRVGRGEATLST